MLRIRAVGDFQVEVGGVDRTPAAFDRAAALLAWLALNPGLHPRSAVAARFWPDVLDESARASLRSAPWSLRRQLADSLRVEPRAPALPARLRKLDSALFVGRDAELARLRRLGSASRETTPIALVAGE